MNKETWIVEAENYLKQCAGDTISDLVVYAETKYIEYDWVFDTYKKMFSNIISKGKEEM